MPVVDDLRRKFLQFFHERDHAVVPPSSLIPDDPSVLLTTAGMQQFKPYYTGERDPLRDVHASLGAPVGRLKAVTIQPCVRTSDIEDVGDATHLTFFEMMGNFAFRGAYFKEEAILLAWEFLTKTIGLPPDRLFVTVFAGDREVPEDRVSREVWRNIGIPEARLRGFGRSDNFWGPTGKEGPCGPTAEIHYDRTGVSCERGEACQPNCACGRFLELWNLVFNEYAANADGALTPLPMKGVDTGMGLERLALVFFDAPDVFSSPMFSQGIAWMILNSSRFPQDAKEKAQSHRVAHALEAAERQGAGSAVRSARIVADHLRAALFLTHEGILPSNTDRGYVLRRIIRRAALHAQAIELPQAWIAEGIDRVLPVYAESYPSLLSDRDRIIPVLSGEREKFQKTLGRGLREFEKMARQRKLEHTALSGADLFRLFETYGFPPELSRELAAERGAAVDTEDLVAVRERHRERSRAGAVKKFGGHGLVLNTGELRASSEAEAGRVLRQHTATHLLQAALRQILGEAVEQRGSDITAERLRFDFTFPRKAAAEEIRKVESLVNEKIREDIAVERAEMPFSEAVASGALAFAKGAYPDVVSVYSVPGFSREVCGGPHVVRTGEIGTFRILKEEAAAAGIRRIRATVEP